jgi:hypothetical protein
LLDEIVEGFRFEVAIVVEIAREQRGRASWATFSSEGPRGVLATDFVALRARSGVKKVRDRSRTQARPRSCASRGGS